MAATHQTGAVDLLNVVAHIHAHGLVHDGALLDTLNEGVAGSVVGDGQAERVLRLLHLHLLGPVLDVREDEVLQPDLTAQ